MEGLHGSGPLNGKKLQKKSQHRLNNVSIANYQVSVDPHPLPVTLGVHEELFPAPFFLN